MERIAGSVSHFTSELGKENLAQNKFMEQLYKKCRAQESIVCESIFNQQALAASEKQHWSKVETMVKESTLENTQVSRKTINHLKQTLVYCFDNEMRTKLKAQLTDLEHRMFPDQRFRAKLEALRPSSVEDAPEEEQPMKEGEEKRQEQAA